MAIFPQIREYITDCVKNDMPYTIFAVTEDEVAEIMKEAIVIDEKGGKKWAKDYLPIYSLTPLERETPGIVGKYMGVNIVRKP